jgi:tartrate dehydrogenase/decarboxylase/D-malate dehydrogenase
VHAVIKPSVDILSARFVLQPKRFDVVVASNLFGDILSDLGPGTCDHRHHWPGAIGQPESRKVVSFPVRTGARIGT